MLSDIVGSFALFYVYICLIKLKYIGFNNYNYSKEYL